MKVITALFMCVFGATHAMAAHFDDLVERYIDLRDSNAPAAVKLTEISVLEKEVDSLKQVEHAKNRLSSRSANLELLASNLTLLFLENSASLEGVEMSAPQFAGLRGKLMKSYERNCKETGQQTSCTNAFYLRMKGSAYKIVPDAEKSDAEATAMLTYARGRRSPHFLETLAGVLSMGIGCEANEQAARRLRSMAATRAPFMLTSRAFEFTYRPDFTVHFSPWQKYEVENMKEKRDLIARYINPKQEELVAKIKELLNNPDTRQLMVDFYAECLIATTNLSGPRTGWPSSEGDFAWKAVMAYALDDQSKKEAGEQARAQIARLVAIEGSSEDEINSVRADIKARFNWSADDSEFERAVDGTAFAR